MPRPHPPLLPPLLAVACLLLGAGAARGADVAARLDGLLAGVPSGGEAGVVLLDTSDHQVLYSFAADTPRTLASTTKLLIACAALLELGPAYEFHTRVLALGPLSAGTIPGLGVIGGGSPCLDGHFAEQDPERFFRAWAEELKRQGVTRVAGDLVIDNRLFSGPIRPATYPQDAENQQRWYSAPASAFAWNDNCIEVRVLPGAAGAPPTVETRPRSPRIQVRNEARSQPGKDDVAISRDLASNTVIVRGLCGRATAWFPLAIQTDPDLLVGDHLKAVLVANGVAVDGAVRLGAVGAEALPLIDLRQGLVPAVTLMNQHSQNFFGEQLLRLVAVARGQPGSVDAGRHEVLAALAAHAGPGCADATLLDGSGLSYGNRASPATMTRLLDAMQQTPLAQVFADSLKDRAVGGVRAHVKTGTLAVACCLVGYLDTPGHRLAFAILFGKGEAAGFGWAPKLRDKVLAVMAEAGGK